MKDRKSKSAGASAVELPGNVQRRAFLKTGVGLAAAGTLSLSAPAVLAQRGNGRVVVRGLGGAYQDAMTAAIYKPFTAATGIEVVVQPATAAQIRAMVQAKRVSLDVVDLTDIAQVALDKVGALAPIDYAGMKYTNPDDIQAVVRKPNMVGNLIFSTVMVYNTDVFKGGNHPKTWSEFWDAKRFPGKRTLADQQSGSAELEFALLADGVPMDKLYPLDVPRALRVLAKIKPEIVMWWNTGAASAQLMERRDAVLGGLWNGRAQDLIDKGAPLAIEWNQAKRQTQALSIIKDSPNAANAQKFIDFALQPKVQAEVVRHIAYGPTNRQALKLLKPEELAKLPSSKEHFAQSFQQDPEWWSENLSSVGQQWQSWVLQRS
ncbi:ABC transporter substrate-binding protein [Chitinasiproducens palmae]|uniref:Putative spermidine/putrescine transport system substrate-binding protein n=1 Tax=Chitinasiproducens palmae TaxID=1770053 RepID=A0A1H2PK05_9BURK|nr:ABC transporter substrate-binding protein [Chitinasiproducens palmae]SDV46738.1 putative spermidine/putrescine transport system substrate-binding protein [Chitinasiproducens palmae]